MFFLSLLGAESKPKNFFEDYWILILLVVVLIALYAVSYVRRKKYNQQVSETLSNLTPGAKVKTYSGFYGTIVSIKETTDGKVALLETGTGNNKSFIEVDINAIYGVDSKEDVVYDAEGNIVSPASWVTPKVEDAAAAPAEKVELSDSQKETEKLLEAEKKPVKKTTKK